MDNVKHCTVKSKLSVCGFSIATGLTSGLSVFILGLLAAHLNVGAPYVTLLGSVYKGYTATYQGSLIGAAWALGMGLVSGFIFSLIYNLIVRKCCCPSCKAACHRD